MTGLLAKSDASVEVSRDGTHALAEATKQKRYRKKTDTTAHVRTTAAATTTTTTTAAAAAQRSGTNTPAYSDAESEYETDTSVDEAPLPSTGGPLKAGELKSLLAQCKAIEKFRDLGKTPPTPPEGDDAGLSFDQYETVRLRDIDRQDAAVQKRLEMWSQREKILDLIVARSKNITDEVKKSNPKYKKVCGYDRRCTWDEQEFLEWFHRYGASVLESGIIGPPDGDDAMSEDEDLPQEERSKLVKGGICVKNNCTKHGTWQKAQIAEVRFEQDRLKEQIGRLERERRRIRERACVRGWEEPVAS